MKMKMLKETCESFLVSSFCHR